MQSNYTRLFPLSALMIFLLAIWVFPENLIAGENEKIPIRTTDLLKIQQPGSVTISPDGNYTAYVVRSIIESERDSEKYRYQNQIWLVRTDGSQKPRQLTFHKAGASNPAWHPDGKRIAFTRSTDGKSQIYVLSLDGGEPARYTLSEFGASNPSWSPDGSKLLYSKTFSHHELTDHELGEAGILWPQEIPGDPRSDTTGRQRSVSADPDGSIEEVRAWLRDNTQDGPVRVLNRLDFQGELDLSPHRSYTHWFVMDDERNAEPQPLTSGFFSFGSASWMPDNETVVLHGNTQTDIHPDRTLSNYLYETSLSDPQPRRILPDHDEHMVDPTPSPDGRYIAFRTWAIDEERGYSQATVGVIDTRNNSVRLLSEDLDRRLVNVKWSPDSRHLFASGASNGGFPLWRMRPNRAGTERLTPYSEGIRDYDVSANRMVKVVTKSSNPYELYSASASGENAARISSHNYSWIQNRIVSKPEYGMFMTTDSLQIDYWYMKPAVTEPGVAYPAVLQIHGGPNAMWGPGEATMWHEFQLFAAHGFAVVYSNPRGSGGYGYDFERANHRDWGYGPMNDVLQSLDHAAEADWIDAENVTVTGGSYGGYLVAYLIAFDHRFRAAAAQRGVYDLVTFFGEGNAWRLVPDRFGGYPWDDEALEVLRADSPFTYVDRIETPLLILHADNDLRTGVSQSEMMYRALKVREKDVEFARYRNAGHDMSRIGDPVQRMDRMLRMIEFMKRYTD